ncbi:MAG: hypothetical protein ABSH29_21020 [Acidimicrobiales bacterium]|jgi:hypothetical protein
MVKVIHVDDNGAEMATVEIDDFTIETVYAGIATLLRTASAASAKPPSSPPEGLSRQERQRREKILTRIHS